MQKKIQTLKNLSPKNKNNKENINAFSSFIKKNKINKNIKEILSLKDNFKKKSKNKLNNIQNEKELIPIVSSSRTNFNRLTSNINYIPITSRDKRLYVSRNQNFEINNEFSKSNTVLLEKNKLLQNKLLSSEKKLLNKNKKDLEEKYLSINIEMNIYQIYEKLQLFCIENNLKCINKGKNNFMILDKNMGDSFMVEIIDSSQASKMNIVKFSHGKNTSAKMIEIITKILFQISNF